MVADRKRAAEQLRPLAERLSAEVIGQEDVIRAVAEWVTHGELGLNDHRKPRGSFMFLGPTGVGKTQLVKALARQLGSDVARFDLSEFQTPDSVDVFLGRGQGDGGRFAAEMARVRDCGVLLFDEFEKAYPRLLDLMLQLLDEGRLTVASGRTYDLRGVYIVLTSNLGAGAAARMRANSDAAVERAVLSHVRQALRPEFFARVDLTCVFRRLSLQIQEKVCRYHVEAKLAELRRTGIDLGIDPAAIQFLLAEGFTELDGARPLERAIQRHVNRSIVDAWQKGDEPEGILRVDPGRTKLSLGGVSNAPQIGQRT